MIIGITGRIATGKSTFCKTLHQDLDAVYIDCDEVVHEQYKPDGRCWNVINMHYPECIGSDKIIDRKKLRSKLFLSITELQKINSLIHPIVASEVRKQIKEVPENRTCIVEAAYLRPIAESCDFSIMVNMPRKMWKEVLTAKNITDSEIKTIETVHHLRYDHVQMVVNNSAGLTEWQEKSSLVAKLIKDGFCQTLIEK